MMTLNNFYDQNGDPKRSNENIEKIISVLAAHGIALWEYDIPTGSCFFPNEYFQILGIDKLGISFSTIEESYPFIHPDDLEAYINFYQKALRTGTRQASLSYRYIGKRGGIVWAEDHFVAHEKDGKLDGLIVYTINITERKQKELQLNIIQNKSKRIVEAMPSLIFIFDRNFFFVDAMASSHTNIFHSPDSLRGADARLFYSPEVSELFISNIEECLDTGELREIEYPLKNGGNTFYYQARIAPYSPNQVVAVIDDITLRVLRSQELLKAKLKAEESDRMKDLFLASMSHEIRTPLNAIVGFSELIPITAEPEERDEYLNIIRSNCTLLLQLIDDVLDLARIEAGKEELHIQSLSLDTLIDNIATIHRSKIPHGVHFVVERPTKSYIIATDANRITQVMNNLLSNAIKNTMEGSITLGVEVKGDTPRFYVTDTGCGIPQNKLESIFERFEKLDEFKQGTGLGLSICRELMERMGGRIEVSSTLGKGSTFSAYLPHSIDLQSPEKG
ncbi:MAG: PAS domain-containing protein [Mediterranea sp.]|nr:PAS domain-containing protein [Mediterranea sp.]